MKNCKECGIKKEHESFNKNPSMKDGRLNTCKICQSKYKKQHRKKNKLKIAENKLIWSHSDNGKKSCLKSRDKYIKSIKGKLTNLRTLAKYPNANRSRRYYYSKNRICVLPTSCEFCKASEIRIEAHHYDYNLPMAVNYLCVKCHKNWHKTKTPLNRVIGIFTEKE